MLQDGQPSPPSYLEARRWVELSTIQEAYHFLSLLISSPALAMPLSVPTLQCFLSQKQLTIAQVLNHFNRKFFGIFESQANHGINFNLDPSCFPQAEELRGEPSEIDLKGDQDDRETAIRGDEHLGAACGRAGSWCPVVPSS